MKIQLIIAALLWTFSYSLLAQAPESEKAADSGEGTALEQTPDVIDDSGTSTKPEPTQSGQAPRLPEPMPPREKALFQNAYEGKLAEVQVLVAKGASANYVDQEQRTALILAASNGHLAVVEFLYGKGADINAQDQDGMTALMYASRRSFNETAAFLLNNGADANVRNRKKGMTALMLASGWGNTELVQLLLDKGANAALQDNFGATAADFARERGHSAIVELLAASPVPKGVQ
jgi:ankyrin repeat protein